MSTTYHLSILKAVATYYTMTRQMIQEICCPADKSGRMTRKRLLQLVQRGLLNKTGMEVVNPATPGASTPVYYPASKGLELLASDLEEERWLHCCTQTPDWTHLLHWVTVAKWHVLLDQAVAAQSEAEIGGWLGEWDIANPEERDPAKRYRLYTLLREKPRLVCNPDAAFLLCVRGFRKIHYLEIDRGTSGIQQIAHSKPGGFAELATRNLHDRQLPTNTDSFFVLSVSPTRQRRDLLRKAITGKPGAQLWKFAAWPELSAETLLYGPVWHRCEGEAQPLIKAIPQPVSAADGGSGAGPGVGPEPVRPGPVRQVSRA